ncbi:MAG: PAS domain-containing protein [Vicinamibacterales bacterium]
MRNAIVGAINRTTGTRTWLQVTAAPRLRGDGTLLHVLVTLVDITDRKRAEEAVRASSRRLALAISATSDAVWEWQYQTGDTYYSPRWFQMLGVSPDLPMTLDTFRSLCHPDDLAPTMKAIEEALNQPDSVGSKSSSGCGMATARGSGCSGAGTPSSVTRGAARFSSPAPTPTSRSARTPKHGGASWKGASRSRTAWSRWVAWQAASRTTSTTSSPSSTGTATC